MNRQVVGACNYIETFKIELVHAEFSQCHCETLILTLLESLPSMYKSKTEKRECQCIDLNERNLMIPKMTSLSEIERK